MIRFRAAGSFTGVGLLIVGMFASTASAQTFRQLYNVATPGARANAMGRAFIGVADDATASVTNPGGLMLLTRPQAYIEFKTGDKEDDGLGGEAGAPATVAFLAASSPVGDRVAVAGTRHVTAAFEGFGLDFEAVSYAGSVAAKVADNVLVGVTLGYITIDEDVYIPSSHLAVTLGGLWTPSEAVTLGVSGFIPKDDLFVPAHAGFGLGLRLVPRTLIAADVSWIGYESAGGGDDATEIHLGGEYSLVTSGSYNLFGRAGFFTTSPDDSNGVDRENVGTFGVGFAIGGRLQLDLAVLTSGEAVVSAGFRF